MQDAQIRRLMNEPPSTKWFLEVIEDQAKMAHVANHHETYPKGDKEFGKCELKACQLARFAYDQADKLQDITQGAACPTCGFHEHIFLVNPGEAHADKQVFHCDNCHKLFVFKPEARPFGGQSRSEFQATLARYVRDQAGLRTDYLQQVVLGTAAAILDPSVGVDDWKMMTGIAGIVYGEAEEEESDGK